MSSNTGAWMGKDAVDTNVQTYDTSRAPMYAYDNEDYHPWYNPRYWRKRVIIGVVLLMIVIIVIVVVIAVVETKKNAYPDYSQLKYTLADTIAGPSFFDNFEYFSGYDPTHGFVHYLNLEQAAQFNLTYMTPSNTAILKVDNLQKNQTTGRYSVRLTSKKAWDNGLFIFDVVHTPYGCATWPALWMTSADISSWPASGEIDIMEQVNAGTSGNLMTLHSTDGCSVSVKRQETATVLSDNCFNGTNNNAGCGVRNSPATFGPQYNAAGGGVVAMELRSAGIRMWQFGRSSIPADIKNGSPDPSTWGTAAADFPSTSCDIGNHFRNQSIIADIDICGDWAGDPTIYAQDSCPGLCTDFAAQNEAAFDNAFWEFGNFTIYQTK